MFKKSLLVMLLVLVPMAATAQEQEGWICVDDGGRDVCYRNCEREWDACVNRCGVRPPYAQYTCFEDCDDQSSLCRAGCTPSYTCVPIE